MFSYFESSVDGIIPNEYTSLEDICSDIYGCIGTARDSCMLTARRFWLANQQIVSPEFPKKIFAFSFSRDESLVTANRNGSAQTHQESNKDGRDDDGDVRTNDENTSNNRNNTTVTSQQQTKKHI